MIADDLVDRIDGLARALQVGDPFGEGTDIGTVIDDRAAELVERRVFAAVEAGARLRSGGSRCRALLTPPVLDHVSPDAELVREETFGPALP